VVLLGPSGVEVATFVVSGPGAPDLASVDLLARWQLCARHQGGRIAVDPTCAELAELLELAGLTGELGGEVCGKSESGEEVGIEEGVEPGDPVA
jgi:hypothetical protein